MNAKTQHIRLSKSVVGEQEALAVSRVITEDGYLGMGSQVQALEHSLQQMLGNEAVCVNSGTAAVHLAVAAVIKPGDEVLVPTITYVATYQAIVAAGGVPVSCDVISENLSIDLVDAERKLSAKSAVILPVLYAGNADFMPAVERFANTHNLVVIQDAAHAFGSTVKGALVGATSGIFCFSFDGIKNITAGEGGVVITDNQTVISYCKTARLLGIENDTQARYSGSRSWQFDVKHIGYRFHMSNINAAIANVQLQRSNAFFTVRKALAHHYQAVFKQKPYTRVLQMDYNDVVPHIFVLLLADGIDRDALRAYLLKHGIESGIHYVPNHQLTLFKSDTQGCPNADRLYPKLLTLPLHPEVSVKDIDFIADCMDRFVEEYAQ